MRRKLNFDNLNQAMAECEHLLASGYEKHGNWSLAQACYHIRVTMEANMNGYPTWMTILGYPLRPFLRWLALPRLLSGNSHSGIPTAGSFVPPGSVVDREEVDALSKCVSEFIESNGALHAHPGFGNMTRDEFNRFHAAHFAHHLSFLAPYKTIAT